MDKDNNFSADDIIKMFDAPVVDDNTEYGHSDVNMGNIEELQENINKNLENINEKGFSLGEIKNKPEDIIIDVCEIDNFNKSEKEQIPISESDDDFGVDELDNNDNNEEIKEEDNKEEEIKEEDNKEEEIKEEDDVIKNIIHHIHNENKKENEYDMVKNGEVQWLLESPSEIYDDFYIKKREIINQYLVGGQVEYERWIHELAESKVDISSEIFDDELMAKQMEEVQMYRERVKYIAIKVYNQYYMFKTFIGTMKGFLAKIQYIKPQTKQDGLIHEHMRDMELYMSRLEALFQSVIFTEKILFASFETLSRKVTICFELEEVERIKRKKEYYANKKKTDNENLRKKLEEFDDLPEGGIVNVEKDKKKKCGIIGWGEE